MVRFDGTQVRWSYNKKRFPPIGKKISDDTDREQRERKRGVHQKTKVWFVAIWFASYPLGRYTVFKQPLGSLKLFGRETKVNGRLKIQQIQLWNSHHPKSWLHFTYWPWKIETPSRLVQFTYKAFKKSSVRVICELFKQSLLTRAQCLSIGQNSKLRLTEPLPWWPQGSLWISDGSAPALERCSWKSTYLLTCIHLLRFTH